MTDPSIWTGESELDPLVIVALADDDDLDEDWDDEDDEDWDDDEDDEDDEDDDWDDDDDEDWDDDDDDEFEARGRSGTRLDWN